MNQFQEKLLEMISWFHQFCVENNLRYYALGGTMLGTVRHGGFIPWDDDLDVGMPRKDYEILEKLMRNLNDDRYTLETPNSLAKDFCYPYFKLYDKTTTLVENQKYKIKRGLYIDIFPLDGLGNSLDEAKYKYRRIDFLRNILLMKTCGLRNGRSFYKNALIYLARIIPINEKKLIKSVSSPNGITDFDSSVFGGNVFGAWRFKEIMPIIIFGKPTLYKFENIYIFGVERAEDYLKHQYGDWKKLPPKDKRVSHHDYIKCNLNKSWLD